MNRFYKFKKTKYCKYLPPHSI